MRRMLWFCLLLLLIPRAEAAALPEQVEDALPPAAEELVEGLETEQVGIHTLSQGFAHLWDKVCQMFLKTVKDSLGGAVLMLGVVVLCSLAEDWTLAAQSEQGKRYATMAGAVTITCIAAGNVRTLIGMGTDMIGELSVFSKVLLPALAAAIAAGGGVVSAGVRHVAGVVVSDIFISVIRDMLLPLVYFYIAVCAAHALLPGYRLKNIGKAISKGTAWLLTGTLALYTGYLTLSGAVAQSTDTLTVQLTKTAMGALPVVGNIMSDAAGTVLAGAAAVKNTIGILGLLAILAICLLPVLELAVQYLLYKITAFLASTITSAELGELIDALGTAFGMVLGMTGACALLLLISLISAVTVVSP